MDQTLNFEQASRAFCETAVEAFLRLMTREVTALLKDPDFVDVTDTEATLP